MPCWPRVNHFAGFGGPTCPLRPRMVESCVERCVCISGPVSDPPDRVGDRQANRGVEQDRVSFGPSSEIRHASLANSPCQAAAKCFSLFPGGDEDDGLGVGHRERLGEHIGLGNGERERSRGRSGDPGSRTLTNSGRPSSRQGPGSHDMLIISLNGLLPHEAYSARNPNRPSRTRFTTAAARSSGTSSCRRCPHHISTSVASRASSERPAWGSESRARVTVIPGLAPELIGERTVDVVRIDRVRGRALAPDPDPQGPLVPGL